MLSWPTPWRLRPRVPFDTIRKYTHGSTLNSTARPSSFGGLVFLPFGPHWRVLPHRCRRVVFPCSHSMWLTFPNLAQRPRRPGLLGGGGIAVAATCGLGHRARLPSSVPLELNLAFGLIGGMLVVATPAGSTISAASRSASASAPTSSPRSGILLDRRVSRAPLRSGTGRARRLGASPSRSSASPGVPISSTSWTGSTASWPRSPCASGSSPRSLLWACRTPAIPASLRCVRHRRGK